MRLRLATLLTCFCVLVTGSANGQQLSLDEAADQLAAAAAAEQNLSPEFKDALTNFLTALRGHAPSMVDHLPLSIEPGPPTFWDRVHPFGDIRLRYENDHNRPDMDARNRERVRLRLGATIDIAPEWEAGFRIRTGNPDDPNSPHQTLDGMFDSFEWNLDRAYLRYTPDWTDGLSVVGGKFAHPFARNPVYGELVWDADVNPEGIAASYKRRVGDRYSVALHAGEYILQEQDKGDEASLFAAQGVAEAKWNDDWSSKLAIAYYQYVNLVPDGSGFTLRDNGGFNRVVDKNGDGINDNFASDFRILNPWFSVTYNGWDYPVTVSGEGIVNTASEGTDHDGYALGMVIGRLSRARDWRLFYQFQRVERDAVFAAFAQDDFVMPSNFKGHVFGGDYGLTDRVSVRAWGLVTSMINTPAGFSDDDQVRMRIDLNAKF